MADRVAGLRYRRENVFAFIHGVRAADRVGLDWGIELEKEPDNPHSQNGTAIKVIGRWVERRKPWFRPVVNSLRREHIGYVPSEITEPLSAALGPLYASIPMAAELYEIAVAQGAEQRTDTMGAIIKIIVLLPSKRDSVWQQLGAQ